MRYRSGKGEALVFDEKLINHLEAVKKKNGFYPTLRVLAETLGVVPKNRATLMQQKAAWGYVYRALRRLSKAGRLSAEAQHVYDAKNKTGDKNENSQKIVKTKASTKAKRIKT